MRKERSTVSRLLFGAVGFFLIVFPEPVTTATGVLVMGDALVRDKKI